MKNLLACFFLFLLASPSWLAAQDEYFEGVFHFEKGQTYYLLADNVLLRSAANTRSESLDKLAIASPVEFLGYEGSFSKDGIKAPFAKVKAGGKTGFIWLPLIACKSLRLDGESRLLFGLEKINPSKNEMESEQVFVQLRLAKKGKEIDKLGWKIGGSLMNLYELKDLGDRKLKNSRQILSLGYGEPMCGGAAGTQFINWDGQKLSLLLHTTHGADVPYYFTSDTHFPNDPDGEANKIIVDYTSGYYDEETEKDIIEERRREVYEWNGKALKKIEG